MGTAEALARCQGDADDVRARARQVMVVVVERAGTRLDLDQWRDLLPTWFVDACRPELTLEEAEAEAERWRSMSYEQQAASVRQVAWSLADWLYWFEPGQRQWFWWDAAVEEPDLVRVTVEVAGWPTPLGALDWLLRAAGAVAVEVVADN